MVVPVTGTIPDSTLSPFQVRQKFQSHSLSGLGDAACGDGFNCISIGDAGTCDACEPDPNYLPPPINFGSDPTYKQPDGTCWPFDPSCPSTGGSVSHGATATGSYMSQGGNIIVTYSDGTFTMTSPDTGSVSTGHGTPPPGAAGTVTATQATSWNAMISALTRAGVQLGTVAMLQPGQSLTANGTIVGSGQSLIGPRGTGINASFSSILQNPMVLIGGFGILALLVLSGGRR